MEQGIEVKWRGASIDDLYNGLEMFERENVNSFDFSSVRREIKNCFVLASAGDCLWRFTHSFVQPAIIR